MSDPEAKDLLAPPRPAAPMPWRDRIELLTRTPPLSPVRAAGAAAGVLALVVVGWLVLRTPEGPPTEALLPVAGAHDERSTTSSTLATGPVYVHAAGAVLHPGVYRLPAGSRVTDLIDAAGGPAVDADLDQLNLAAPVKDGERIYVPRVGESLPTVGTASGDGAVGALVDLNRASLAELDALPGIGPATAQAIIDERERRGGFTSVDDLLDVRGIGPAKLEAIRDLVTV